MNTLDRLCCFLFPETPPRQQTHLGFAPGAPEEVVWPQGSVVRPVAPDECADFRKAASRLARLWVGLAALVLLMAYLAEETLSGLKIPIFLRPEMLFLFLLPPLLLSFLYSGPILKQLAILQIRRRAGRLFEPDRTCHLVEIEDVETCHQAKLTADDFGLLHIAPEGLYIELQTHRAFLRREETQVVYYSSKDPQKIAIPHLLLLCAHPQWPYLLRVVPAIQSLVPFADFDLRARNAAFMERLQRIAGIEITREFFPEGSSGVTQPVPVRKLRNRKRGKL